MLVIARMLTNTVTGATLAVKTTIGVFNPSGISLIVGMPFNALGDGKGMGIIVGIPTYPYVFSGGEEF